MDAREQRAIIIAAMVRLEHKDGIWLVPSQSDAAKKYKVKPDGEGTCSCPDHQESGFCCKHIRAVRIVVKREMNKDGSITETKSIAFEEKKTYSRNWVAYNEAQHTEKRRFCALLADLCSRFPEQEQTGKGRKRVSIADRLFSVVYKVYTTISSRRFATDLEDAVKEGHLSRTLHPNKVNTFMELADLTPYLRTLIVPGGPRLNGKTRLKVGVFSS